MKRILMLVAVLLAAIGFHSATVSALSPTDTADLKITNIEGSPRVTLYKIGTGQYTAAGDTFVKFNYATGINDGINANVTLTETGPTTKEVNAIANALLQRSLTAMETTVVSDAGATGNSVTHRVTGAGVYIAILTGASNGRSYNPILLAASYNGNGSLVGGNISTQSNYLHGDTAVAKSTLPKIDKSIVSGTAKDTTAPVGQQDTVSIGDVVEYKLELTMPSYAANARNKTIFVTDTLHRGLKLDYSSLTVTWKGQAVRPNAENKLIAPGSVELGTAHKATYGFNINFNYDNLAGVAPVITYKAVANSELEEGKVGNKNTAGFYYGATPNSDQGTWPHAHQIPTANTTTGIGKVEDVVNVYTYYIAFKKVDSLNTGTVLKDAVFGIYSDPQATKLVDVLVSNTSGYAQSSEIGAGTYYLKEITAPNGYTLNTQVYPVEVKWTSATTKTSIATNRNPFTADANAGLYKTQVGWLKDNVFYKMDNKPAGDNVVAAYFGSASMVGATAANYTANAGAGAGTVMMADIKNTKLGELPSTGGMGTYLFTFAGVLVMSMAAALYVRKREGL